MAQQWDVSGIPDAPTAKPTVPTAPPKWDVSGIADAPKPIDPALKQAVTTQLARTDLPDDVRGELEAISNGTSPTTGNSQVLTNLKNLFLGAKSGLMKSAFHGGDVIRRVLGMPRVITNPDAQAAMTAPPGPFGTAGQLAEQTAEFVQPANAVTDVLKGTQVAARLVRAGIPIARARLAAGLVEGAGQAATAAGVTKLHGDEGATSAAVVSGALPVAGAALETAYPAIKAGAVAKMQQFMAKAYKPEELTPRLTKITTDAAKEVLDAPIQNTWKGWRETVAGQRAGAGATLSAALAGPAGDVPISKQPILDALDDLIATKAQHSGPLLNVGKGQFSSGSVTYNKPLAKAVEDLKDLLNEYPDQIPTRQLHDIKQVWQRAVFPLRDSSQPVASIAEQLTSAQKEAHLRGMGAINDVLDAANPKIANLDESVAHAIRLDQLVKRLQGKAKVTPGTAAAMYAGGGALGYTASNELGAETYGGHILGAHLGYATARMLKLALENPRWQTLSPRMRNALAEAIADGTVRTVRRIVAPLAASAITQASGSTTPADRAAATASP